MKKLQFVSLLLCLALALGGCGNVLFPNDLAAVQIGNGSGNFQYPVIGTGTQPQLIEHSTEQCRCGIVHGTEVL